MAEEVPWLTEVAEALVKFGQTESSSERYAALTTLIGNKFLPKHADHPSILVGRAQWLSDAVQHSDPAHRLLAVAESIRLTQVVKKWLPTTMKSLEGAFSTELPPLQLLRDADDRLNVARACRLFTSFWLHAYIAKSIAEEEQGEKARLELIDALFAKGGTLSELLRDLAKNFSNVRPKTDSPGETIAKRLTRTLAAFRVVLMDSENPVGFDLGKSLLDLVSDTLAEIGRPEEEKTKIDLSREVLLTVHDLVRTRLSVVADPSMYLSVSYCRRLCGGAGWPSALNRPLERLIADVCEALVLLGRQGMRDQVLLGQLDILCKYPERARALARELAAQHPELSEDVRDWLERGRLAPEKVAPAATLESFSSTADASIGLALQASRHASRATEGLRERLMSSLETYEPALVGIAQDALDRVKALSVQVDQAARLRNIELYGFPGEEVDASPKFFDVVGDHPRQKMIVRQPAIIRIRGDSAIGEVVLRGLVE